MKVGIIGGGISGLSLGYFLTKKGHQVFLFEKEKELGGLLSFLKKKEWSWTLEKFFHHFFSSDKELIELLKNLNLKEKIFFKRVKTSLFLNGKICQFDSPESLLRFPFFSFFEKIKTGLITFFLKYPPFFPFFGEKKAMEELEKLYGKRVFSILWKELFLKKFGEESQEISLAWFLARLKKRETHLGYLKGGFSVLIEALKKEIEKSGGIFLKKEILDLREIYSKFDRIIFTTPLPVFLKITEKFFNKNKVFIDSLKKIQKMYASYCLVLSLKREFLKDGTYWLNINEKNFPFVVLVEHTNMVPKLFYGNETILYVGGYAPLESSFLKMDKKRVFEIFFPFLKKISFLSRKDIIDYHFYKYPFAQPIIFCGYKKYLPSFFTPDPKIYFLSTHHIYPWDRGLNFSIKLAKKLSEIVEK